MVLIHRAYALKITTDLSEIYYYMLICIILRRDKLMKIHDKINTLLRQAVFYGLLCLDLQANNKEPIFEPDDYGNIPATSMEFEKITPSKPLFSLRCQEESEISFIDLPSVPSKPDKSGDDDLKLADFNLEMSVKPYIPSEEEKLKIIEEADKFKDIRYRPGIFSYVLPWNRQVTCEVDLIDLEIMRGKTKLKRQFADTDSMMGYIVVDDNYLIQSYKDYVLKLLTIGRPTILDIGTGLGDNSIELVREGAILTANDLSLKQLARLRAKLAPKFWGNLFINNVPFPEKMEQPENYFDAILLSHVAHYLSGPQIRNGMKKIHRWLKPGGKLFFQALTPYSNPYHWRAFVADKNLKVGMEWPGWFTKFGKEAKALHGPEHKYGPNRLMPNFGHPIHPKIIERELKNAGYEIDVINYGILPTKPYVSSKTKSPISYQDHEFYVLRDCKAAGAAESPDDKARLDKIREALSSDPTLQSIMDKDRIEYCNALETPGKVPAIFLTSMQIVQVIATKK